MPTFLRLVILPIEMTEIENNPDPLRKERVADAVLHLVRLAASQADYGITFVDLDLVPDETDAVSLKVLEDVVETLLKDRMRVAGKMADVLMTRTHRIVTEAFAEAQQNPEVEQAVEDVIARRLADGIGFKLSPAEEKALSVDTKFIKEQKGASNAAATALGRAFGLETGRSIYSARKQSRQAAPVPGPLNRWVPQSHVRKYLKHLLQWVESVRRAYPMLPLSELRDITQVEPLIDRVERCFREDARARYEEQKEIGFEFLAGVLRGGPVPEKYAEHWAPYQQTLDALRAQLVIIETQISDREPAEVARIMDSIIRAFAELWMTDLMKELDLA